MLKQLLWLAFAIFCVLLAQSQTPPAAGSLPGLTSQLLATAKSFNASGDKRQLHQQLRNQTTASVQLMRRNSVKLSADDINKSTDGLKAQLAGDSSVLIKGDELTAFINRLKERLTKALGSK
jgi:hypothetical protein